MFMYIYSIHILKSDTIHLHHKESVFSPQQTTDKKKDEPHHDNHLFNIHTQNWHDSLTSKLESMSSARLPVFLFVCVVARQSLWTCGCTCTLVCYVCAIMGVCVYTSMWMNVFCLELRNIFVRLHLTDICVYVLVYLVYMWFTYGVYCYMWFTCGVYYIVILQICVCINQLVYMWSILLRL